MATPIGNIGDLSPRACEVLGNAYMVLAEDTRRAARLLAEVGVRHNGLISFFDHNEQGRIKQAQDLLLSGHDVALITDAGTPLLSDPGYRLVRACRKENFPVSAVPGPAAPIAALSAAGIAPLPFTFLGFLPRGKSGRLALFRMYGSTPATLVFFERKDRAAESLALAYETLGERELAICRELTKSHEEFIIGKLSDGAKLAADLLGELTIVIGPPEEQPRLDMEEVMALLDDARHNGLGAKEAARDVASRAPGWKIKELYDLLLLRDAPERP